MRVERVEPFEFGGHFRTAEFERDELLRHAGFHDGKIGYSAFVRNVGQFAVFRHFERAVKRIPLVRMRRPYPGVHFRYGSGVEQTVRQIGMGNLRHGSGVHDVEPVGLAYGGEVFLSAVFEYAVAREAVSFRSFERSGPRHIPAGHVVRVDRGRSEIPERVAEDVEIVARYVGPGPVFRKLEMRRASFCGSGRFYQIRSVQSEIRNLPGQERRSGEDFFAYEVVQVLATEFFPEPVNERSERFGFERDGAVFGGTMAFERPVPGDSGDFRVGAENLPHARIDEDVATDFPVSKAGDAVRYVLEMRVVHDAVRHSRHMGGVQPKLGIPYVGTYGFPVRKVVREPNVEDFPLSVGPRPHARRVKEVRRRIGVRVGGDSEGFHSGILSESFERIEKERLPVLGVEPDSDRRFLEERQVRPVGTRNEAMGFLGVACVTEEELRIFAGFFRGAEIAFGMQPPDFERPFPMVRDHGARKHPVRIGIGIRGEMDYRIFEIRKIRQSRDFRTVPYQFELSSHGGG